MANNATHASNCSKESESLVTAEMPASERKKLRSPLSRVGDSRINAPLGADYRCSATGLTEKEATEILRSAFNPTPDMTLAPCLKSDSSRPRHESQNPPQKVRQTASILRTVRGNANDASLKNEVDSTRPKKSTKKVTFAATHDVFPPAHPWSNIIRLCTCLEDPECPAHRPHKPGCTGSQQANVPLHGPPNPTRKRDIEQYQLTKLLIKRALHYPAVIKVCARKVCEIEEGLGDAMLERRDLQARTQFSKDNVVNKAERKFCRTEIKYMSAYGIRAKRITTVEAERRRDARPRKLKFDNVVQVREFEKNKGGEPTIESEQTVGQEAALKQKDTVEPKDTVEQKDAVEKNRYTRDYTIGVKLTSEHHVGKKGAKGSCTCKRAIITGENLVPKAPMGLFTGALLQQMHGK